MVIPLSGIFKTIQDFNVESCSKISGPDGFKNCEDGILSDQAGVIYTSCEPDRALFNPIMGINMLEPGKVSQSGALWKVNYVAEPAIIEKFEINKEFDSTTDFHPLGIAIDYHPITKAKTLVVINLPHHKGQQPSIEFFDMDDEHARLTHKRTIQHPKIYTPNSIHILNDVRFRSQDGTPSFFFSNDHYFTSFTILKRIENYFFYLSNVGFYNARTDQVEKGVNGLLFANGLSGNDDVLFVSETMKGHVKKYEIQVTSTDDKQGVPHINLNHVMDAKFDFATDNVRYIAEKNLLVVAGHPKGLDLLKYSLATDKTKVGNPPSQVDIWDLKTGEQKTLIRDNGDLFRTSSTGIIDIKHSKLIVTGLLEEGVLVCDV